MDAAGTEERPVAEVLREFVADYVERKRREYDFWLTRGGSRRRSRRRRKKRKWIRHVTGDPE